MKSDFSESRVIVAFGHLLTRFFMISADGIRELGEIKILTVGLACAPAVPAKVKTRASVAALRRIFFIFRTILPTKWQYAGHIAHNIVTYFGDEGLRVLCPCGQFRTLYFSPSADTATPIVLTRDTRKCCALSWYYRTITKISGQRLLGSHHIY